MIGKDGDSYQAALEGIVKGWRVRDGERKGCGVSTLAGGKWLVEIISVQLFHSDSDELIRKISLGKA
ncbi:hypothetical protein DQK91_14930 [Oceanidesulfovibrio marinus]|uniref:Uncharacterized protein n=1 Tax=Oceanidesulfovibrio marinus TaxID=370038 RepID=A0A6P1ZDP2_9BACT|nr:hypothetical protein DQK91_14930 [Oceanidesulfovibrio marinus]